MQDLPTHLALVDVLAHRGDEAGWSERFTSRLTFAPYAGYYGLALAGARLLGAELATKLLLSLYVLSLPLCLRWVLRVLDARSTWPALFAFALAYNDAYLVGFVGFLLAVPLVLSGWALALGLATERYALGRAGWAVALVAAGLFLLHPLGLALLLLLASVSALALRPPRGALLRTLLALAPAAALFAVSLLDRGASLSSGFWLPASTKAPYLLGYPWLWLEGSSRPLLFASLLPALGGLLLLLRDARRGESSPLLRVPVASALACVLTYAALPWAAGAVVWLDARFALFAWLLVPVILGCLPAPGSLRRALLLCACALLGLGALVVHLRFDRELAPLEALLARAPRGARVLPVLTAPQSEAVQPFYVRSGAVRFFSLHAHFASLYRLRRGGSSPFLTFHPSLQWVPLALREPAYQVFFVSDPFRPRRLLEHAAPVLEGFDVVLLRGPEPQGLAALRDRLEERDREGLYRLYRVLPPRASAP